MNERIDQIIQALKIKKSDFAKKLNISQAFVSQMCSGVAKPSDRTISDICRVFNVNRRYLELGEEPMFMPELDPDTEYINALLADSDSPFIDVMRAILKVYVQLTPEDQKRFNAFAASLRDNLKDRG